MIDKHEAPTTMESSASTPDLAENEQALDSWLDRFFANYYATRPVNATFIGIHEHDHRLPDVSAGGMAGNVAEMQALRVELSAIPMIGLDDDRQTDALLADGFLDLQIMEAELPQFHIGNPAHYTGEAVFSVISLFQRDAEPIADRIDAAISRMRAIPEYLDRARQNLDGQGVPVAWTDHALREANSSAIYFSQGMTQIAAKHGIRAAELVDAGETARQAMLAFAGWLDESLPNSPTTHVSCGREAFDRYLAKGHCLPEEQDSTWLAGYAESALRNTQLALEEKAGEIDPTVTWQQQLVALADLHPAPGDYYAAYPRAWDAAREAAIEAGLVTWPDYPIEYVPIPETDREAAKGLYYLFYRCPPPFGRPETHRYLVTPLPPDSQPGAQLELLRRINDSVILLNHVVHHGGLGHHVQNWHAFRAPSRIGKVAGVDCASRIAMFCGGTHVEGWACYATDLMDEIGFLTPLQSLSEAQSRVRMAARAVADVAIHTGAMTLDEAAAFYEREAGMDAGGARSEAIKNSMFPGAAMMYLVGTQAIHDLRQAQQDRLGSGFSLRDFHDTFLRFGAIPTAVIARRMTA